jgi:hypothetical protein
VAENQPANKNRMTSDLSIFAARVSDYIAICDAAFFREQSNNPDFQKHTDAEFNGMALMLFMLQFRFNPAYRKICEARNIVPDSVNHWTSIPAVPTSAFKELELSCFPSAERARVFHSSGTTGQRPSRHFHNAESLRVYKTSLLSWFNECVLADVSQAKAHVEFLALTPLPDDVPHSSLVHMFETVRREHESHRFYFVGKLVEDNTWALDFDAVLKVLREVNHPLVLLGTAFSFVHLLTFLEENNLRFQLPPSSRVMETGGYKNRSRALPKSELHALISERLGISAKQIICEYGMSELSSQAYDCSQTGDASRIFHFPPWTRAQVVSPENGRQVAVGETGLLRIFDLANVFSVMAIQTEDLAIRRGDGFELIGRAAQAEPRGCSLMATDS